MFLSFWSTFFFEPVYNVLIFFVDVVPGGDVGIAIIFTTILIKTVLLPLSIKAAKTQKIMREIEPKIKEIKEKFKDKKEEQARAMLDIYKEAGMNPFSSIFVFILQIPLVIALYLSVYGYGGYVLPEVNMEVLYSFLSIPSQIDMYFLGFVDMAGKSLVLALLAGATMFLQMRLMMPKLPDKNKDEAPDFKADFARNMQLQMKYVMPIVITVAAYAISAAIALYFVVSNVFAIAQEFYVRRLR